MGDFNTPPRGRVYRELTAKFEDGFRTAGYGAGYTYPARRPLMRIDYVFTTAGITVKRCRVIPVQASDHLPVIADIGLAEKRR
jgi:endonuclease/exonuclease/phosphatase family metal-dependent hydrolase